MNPYVIYTDSACDIVPETLSSWGVSHVGLTFRIDGDETEYTEHDIPSHEFYNKMRAGAVAKTAAINAETFRAAFEAELKQGRDVLYLGFSSGLSATFNSARIAAQELEQDYPGRRVITVDSLCASAGFGLLVFLATEKRNEGATLDELADYLKATVPSICHWFTVDDLVYLKRGGRISPTVAFVGNLLGIKPVLHVDDEGHLINMTKVRGRRAAIHALAQKYGELLADASQNMAFISHGDCPQDAELLKSILEKDYGANVTLITPVGTVIGAHSGPGTLALFFLGKNR